MKISHSAPPVFRWRSGERQRRPPPAHGYLPVRFRYALELVLFLLGERNQQAKWGSASSKGAKHTLIAYEFDDPLPRDQLVSQALSHTLDIAECAFAGLVSAKEYES